MINCDENLKLSSQYVRYKLTHWPQQVLIIVVMQVANKFHIFITDYDLITTENTPSLFLGIQLIIKRYEIGPWVNDYYAIWHYVTSMRAVDKNMTSMLYNVSTHLISLNMGNSKYPFATFIFLYFLFYCNEYLLATFISPLITRLLFYLQCHYS